MLQLARCAKAAAKCSCAGSTVQQCSANYHRGFRRGENEYRYSSKEWNGGRH
ncbi:hypothetical protein HRbin36_02876 [bacterium HR36]|nr:hypothetical protein HRbin36_02876 [bacterium HR36]